MNKAGEGVSKGGERPATTGTFGSKVSFRDKVVGVSTPKPLVIDESLEGDRLAVVDGGNGGRPKVTFSSEGRKVLAEPYKDSIVVKVLGKHVSYTALSHRLRFIWRLKGGYKILDVGNDYFLVKCDLLEDREKVLLGGPWKIDGFYLTVKPWSFEFHPAEKSFGSTFVWVRFNGLKILYYQEKAMQRIASAIGKPIKVDVATKEAERGKFARACILIDLGVPVIDEIKVDDIIYKVDYEHLELICDKCRCFGHVAVDCKKVNDVKVVEEEFSLPENDNQHVESTETKQGEDAFIFGKSSIAEGKQGDPKLAPSKVHEELGYGKATNQEEAIGAWIKVIKKKGKVQRDVDKNLKSQGPKNNRPITKKQVVVANLSKRPSKYGPSSSVKSNNQSKGNNNKHPSPSHEGTVAGTSGSKSDTPIFHHHKKRLRPSSLQNSPQEVGAKEQDERDEKLSGPNVGKGKEIAEERVPEL